MENIILIIVLAAILGSAGFYVYKAKKSGKKCIGCPDSGSCASKKGNCCCGCNSSNDKS